MVELSCINQNEAVCVPVDETIEIIKYMIDLQTKLVDTIFLLQGTIVVVGIIAIISLLKLLERSHNAN